MHRGAVHVTIGIISLAVLGAWVLVRPAGTGTQVAPAAAIPVAGRTGRASTVEVDLASLKAEMATLRREHEQLSRRLRALEAAPNRAASGVQPSPPSAEEEKGAETETEPRLSEEKQVIAMLSELDLRLSQEPDDPTWSQRAELDIATLLHPDAIAGSRVLSADCHATLCRVEVEHADGSAQSQLVDHLPMEPPFDGEMLFHQIDDNRGAPSTLIYLARQGHPLLATAQ